MRPLDPFDRVSFEGTKKGKAREKIQKNHQSCTSVHQACGGLEINLITETEGLQKPGRTAGSGESRLMFATGRGWRGGALLRLVLLGGGPGDEDEEDAGSVNTACTSGTRRRMIYAIRRGTGPM